MYNELKLILDFIAKNEPFRFKHMFGKIGDGLSSKDQEKNKTFLIDENVVENHFGEGNEFGIEPHYSFTSYGKRFYNETTEYEILDGILKYLSDNKSGYLDLKYVCKKISVPYSKTYALKLLHDHMIVGTEYKNGDEYQITDSGEHWILVRGGYRQQLVLLIDETLIEKRTEKEKRELPIQPIH